jgi:hypothetical protein
MRINCRVALEISFILQASPTSLPRIPVFTGTGPMRGWRDPWFDRLTTLSEVEGESRKIAEQKIILDPLPKAAGDDQSGHSLFRFLPLHRSRSQPPNETAFKQQK